LKKLLGFIVGSEDSFSLQQRLLNVNGFFGAIIFLQATVLNSLLGFPPVVAMVTMVSAFVMGFLFYLSRVKHLYDIPVLLTLSFLLFLTFPFLWITNGGLSGPIPYWYIYLMLALAILLKGRKKLIFFLIGFAIATSLGILEYSDFITVIPYETPEIAFVDVFSQLLLVGVIVYILVSSVIRNYGQEHEKTLLYSMELKKANEELAVIVNTDFLTKLFNRTYISDKMEYEKKRMARYKKPFSLLLADIDHFKRVNDNFGHNFGDIILQGVANALLTVLRQTDTPSRWGGEEFLVLLPETSLEDAYHVAEKLRTTIEKTIHHYNGAEHVVTLSVGISVYTDAEGNEEIIKCIQRADEALYESKRIGRNRVTSLE